MSRLTNVPSTSGACSLAPDATVESRPQKHCFHICSQWKPLGTATNCDRQAGTQGRRTSFALTQQAKEQP